MTGITNVALRDAQVERAALHIYELAYRTMEVVTRQLVDQELERLAAHKPGCGCSPACAIAGEVSASRVWWVASRWQNSVTTRSILGAGPVR